MRNHIADWQEELQTLGLYTGLIDGDFGPKTLGASMAAIQPCRVTDSGRDKKRPPAAFELSSSDVATLATVEPALQAVVMRAVQLSTQRFAVAEGIRTKARQAELVAKGTSKTMNSRHLTGHAVDLWPIDSHGRTDWQNLTEFLAVVDAMMMAAKELGYPLTSGGLSWGWDYPHFQRTWGT